jgi:hypothetical protein
MSTSKSGCHVTSSPSISPENRNILLLGTRQRLFNPKRLWNPATAADCIMCSAFSQNCSSNYSQSPSSHRTKVQYEQRKYSTKYKSSTDISVFIVSKPFLHMTLWQVPLSVLWMILTFNIVIGVTIFPLEDVVDILKGLMTLPFLDGCLRRMTSIESKSVCPRIYELWQTDFIAGRETNPKSAQYISWYWHELKNIIVLYLYMCICIELHLLCQLSWLSFSCYLT